MTTAKKDREAWNLHLEATHEQFDQDEIKLVLGHPIVLLMIQSIFLFYLDINFVQKC